MKLSRALLPLVTLLLLCACGPRGIPAPGETTPATPATSPAPAADPRGWTVTSTEDRASPAVLTVTLRVPGPLRVMQGCGVTFGLNVWLADAAGQQVTAPRVQNYMCVRPPAGGYPVIVVAPGTTQTFTGDVALVRPGGQAIPPGRYLIEGVLSVDPASGVSGTIPATPVTIA